MTARIEYSLPISFQARVKQLQTQSKETLAIVLEKIANALTANSRDRISETKQDPEGNVWQALNPAYEARKTAKGKTAGKLIYSGDLLQSLVGTVENGTANVSSRHDYAQFLQDGTSKMPARPFAGLGAEDKQSINHILNDELQRLFK